MGKGIRELNIEHCLSVIKYSIHNFQYSILISRAKTTSGMIEWLNGWMVTSLEPALPARSAEPNYYQGGGKASRQAWSWTWTLILYNWQLRVWVYGWMIVWSRCPNFTIILKYRWLRYISHRWCYYQPFIVEVESFSGCRVFRALARNVSRQPKQYWYIYLDLGELFWELGNWLQRSRQDTKEIGS